MMRSLHYILLWAATLLLSTMALAQSQDTDIPITFTRAGRKVVPQLENSLSFKELVLQAYGRTLSSSVPVMNLCGLGDCDAVFNAPLVRVPTVFAITPAKHADEPQIVLGELIVYPDRDVKWDKNISLYSCEAPWWFDQWASAIGLPVKQIALSDLASAKLSSPDEKNKNLLILGLLAAMNLQKVAKFADDKKINIFIPNADWGFVAYEAGPVSIAPSQMLGGLADIATQHWPRPLQFSSHPLPWRRTGNRWAWIMDGNDMPLVEQVALTQDHPPIILNYIPWDQQLGRNEVADEVFLHILRAAAEAVPPPLLDRPVKMLWPTTWPSLTEGVSYANDRTDSVVVIMVDDSSFPDDDVWNTRNMFEGNQIIVLGDHPRLDEWEWLKLNEEKKQSDRSSVFWIPDFYFGSKPDQIRLMLKLTELGVPLATNKNQ